MISTSLTNAAKMAGGTLIGSDAEFSGVSTDTRSLGSGQLFVALQGPNFDGTRFLKEAEQRGAAGAIVDREAESPLPLIQVEDSLLALGKLGGAWRREMSATVVGITGSNGKTTLKELLASCLSVSAPTLATYGNLNNEIGVPLMLLRMKPEHRFAVIEMGANHAGEIGYLTSLVAPRIVAISNAAPAHLEGFGSVEGVARAKGEILCGEPAAQRAVLNADDDYFEYWIELAGDTPVVSFGLSGDADVRASGINAFESGSAFTLHVGERKVDVRLPLAGKHNVLNACAAAAMADVLGLDMQQIRMGLEAVAPVGGRLQPVTSASGATLFDDSYNANPVSVQAAADFLASQEGESWLVLGDMAELGDDAELLHAHTGWVIREAGIQNLFATGPLSKKTVESFGDGGRWFETIDSLSRALVDAIAEGDTVLVKGSRSMGMERVVEVLTTANDKARSA